MLLLLLSGVWVLKPWSWWTHTHTGSWVLVLIVSHILSVSLSLSLSGSLTHSLTLFVYSAISVFVFVFVTVAHIYTHLGRVCVDPSDAAAAAVWCVGTETIIVMNAHTHTQFVECSFLLCHTFSLYLFLFLSLSHSCVILAHENIHIRLLARFLVSLHAST